MDYSILLKSLGLSIEIAPQLVKLEQLFARWNERINLSAARTSAEIAEHVIDSLHVVPHVRGTRVLDVGAGGGFPSLIVALMRPEADVVALEPTHKKHAFLRTAARELELANYSAFARRLEDQTELDFDVAMSRATFDLREWLERGLDTVRVGGIVIGFEGLRRDDLPARTQRHPYDLAGKQRAIVIVERVPLDD